ncbi:hypothetical protein LOZ58_003496 [Ophidiomyces ophidiicola]|nr:hypothetical protein LOZ58_003496 [Ophidiomyces ophidiicola]
MARLNDLPPAAESLESLKRRFIRQNRELARANSLQSARIRTLEADVTRVLAENVTLRDEIGWLKGELEKSQGSDRFDTQLFTVKEKLGEKLAELSTLITDLGTLPQRRKNILASKQTLETQGICSPCVRPPVRPGHNAFTDEERLPVIMEDKFYPRLTPEVDEIPESPINDGGEQKTSISPTPSPNRLDSADFSATFLPDGLLGTSEYSSNDIFMPPAKSPTLETRRRRRDSSLLKNIIPNVDAIPGNNDLDFNPQPSKTGSKRKFTLQENDLVTKATTEEPDDFQYNRLTVFSESIPQEIYSIAESQPTPTTFSVVEPVKRDRNRGRRALGPKSSNANLASPVKASSEKMKPHVEAKRPPVRSKGKSQSKPKTEDISDLNTSKSDAAKLAMSGSHSKFLPTRKVEESIPTETALEISNPRIPKNIPSPNSFKILSDVRPTELHSSETTRTRQSRRSRGPISYAEPNLRDKMRRPTEELIDAVGSEKTQHASKQCAESNESCPTGEYLLYSAQSERCEPLRSITTLNAQGSTAISNFEQRLGPSASSIAISTLVAGSKKRCQSSKPNESRRHSANPANCSANPHASHSISSRDKRLDTLNAGSSTDITGFDESMEESISKLVENTGTDPPTEGEDSSARTRRIPVTRRRSMMV